MTIQSFEQAYESVLLSLFRNRISPKSAIAKRYRSLPFNEQVAIALRYWGNSTIEEVAAALDVSWDEADQILAAAEAAMKNELLAEMKIVVSRSPRTAAVKEHSSV